MVHIAEGAAMRTNIEIEDELIQKALQLSGLKTKRAVVEAGLRMLIRVREQEEILKLGGKARWQGNLDESRRGRGLP
jgi:Arc/MetJ family transcription regulator